jgi:hypothetical protein
MNSTRSKILRVALSHAEGQKSNQKIIQSQNPAYAGGVFCFIQEI